MEKRSNNANKKFNSQMQARLLLVFCVVTLLLVGLMARLIYINQTNGERYAKHVLSRQTYVSSVLPYKRGDILDRNGTVLARSELQYKLILDPKLLILNEDNIAPTITALSKNFEIEAETIQSILEEKPNSQYVIVLKNLQYDKVQAFEAMMEEDDTILGVWFEEEYVRSYPYKTLASDVLGFTSADNKGFWGIEEYYNDELNGTNGREYGYYDSTLDIERIVKKAVNGNSVVSTIDANAQRIIQKHIIEFNEEFGSKGIGVLIMNPNNGEIIAMASNQEYDLNNPRNLEGIYTEEELAAMTEEQKTQALNTLWKNDIISSSFEPGSTFKPVTIAAALEEAIVTKEDTYYCDGVEVIGSSKIKCSKRVGHGELTLMQALMFSCNDALMQIAAKEGKSIFYRYQNSFGFGKKTGIDLPGEEAGIIKAVDSAGATDLATNSFGQNLNTTMIQMAAAYSSLVNGGYYYRPHTVKQIVNDSGATVKEFDELLVRETVSEETSEFIQQSMYQTVEAGTAGGAKVEGYAIGGKTGTAQKLPREAKTYVVSFLGQVPAINPEIVIYVIIDEPQNVVKQADSSIATKFASGIMKEVLPAVGIYPEGDIDYLLPSEENAGNQTGDATTNTTGTDDTQRNEQTAQEGNSQNTGGSEDNQDATQTGVSGGEQVTNQENNSTGGETTEGNDGGLEQPNPPNGQSGTEDDATQNSTGSGAENANQATNSSRNVSEDEFNADALD